jgi:asparagine synthase (glutamine-hydrolysing)
MCGISGFIDFNKKSSRDHLVQMTDVLTHRGPDAGGYEFINKENCNVGLGHRRLSIIDLSCNANQPFKLKDWSIVYNGEIYNFQEIRSELEQLGRVFSTTSDTEVLINAFDEWKEHSIDKLIGMFSFAIYNHATELLYLVRDRVGVKPLYYYWHDGLFLFSSELKSFHSNPWFKKELNQSAIAEYLQLGYIQTPNCVFEYSHKLQAGSMLSFDVATREISIQKYWSVNTYYGMDKLEIGEQEAIDETRKLLVSSFKYRLLSDVPVGLFLSGGMDSSLVTAILQKESSTQLNTITIGFNEKQYDEAIYAKKVAEYLGTNHTEYYCTQKDALEIVPSLPYTYDEPFGDSSAIPTILVSKVAAQIVKVALSADGGDELFGGYDDYITMLRRHELISKVPRGIRQMASLFSGMARVNFINNSVPVKNFETIQNKFFRLLQSDDIYESGVIFSQVFTDQEISRLMKETDLEFNFKDKPALYADKLSNLLSKDFNSYLADDIMVKVDRATMSTSIEGREPFLDHRLIEFVARLPSEFKIRNGEKKYLLKKILSGYVPEELTNRPKMGFAIPVIKWLNDELKDFVLEYLSEEKIVKQQIFDWKYVKSLLNNFYNRNNINERKIWYLLIFQLWYEKWVGF